MLQKYNQRLISNEIKEDAQILRVSINLINFDNPSDFKDVEDINEKYSIKIDKNQNQFYEATLKCYGYVSFLRAVETLHQLLSQEQIIHNLPLYIKDEPAVKLRGLMVDTSRRFFTIEQLEKHLDAMRLNKLNTLHLHFTDAESFPIDIPNIPELSKYGAYSKQQIYYEADIQRLQKYALENGVLLIPEFDTPAHTLSWSQSEKYQEINSCSYLKPDEWGQCGYQSPCGTLNPIHELSLKLVKEIHNYTQTNFVSDIIHIGADEVRTGCWEQNTQIKEFMEQNNIQSYHDLKTWFIQKSTQILKQNKKVMYWVDNINNNIQDYVRSQDIIQYWGYDEDLKNYKLKNKIILSQSDILYLDCGKGNLFGGTSSWCGSYKTWDFLYKKFNLNNYDYLGNRLLGVIAPLWTELVGQYELDSALYPRTISLAMKLWNKEEQLNIHKLARKLIVQNNRLQNILNIRSGSITTKYCEKNVEKCFF